MINYSGVGRLTIEIKVLIEAIQSNGCHKDGKGKAIGVGTDGNEEDDLGWLVERRWSGVTISAKTTYINIVRRKVGHLDDRQDFACKWK